MAGGALSIKLRCASWQQLATIYRRDLSRGTMFLRASTPPPIGTSVRIDLTLPSASVIVLSGVVQQHVNDPQRGAGVELKLAPIPTGSIWMIESALASEQKRMATPVHGVPIVPSGTASPQNSAAFASVHEGEDVSAAEAELKAALLAEVDSLKKLNPFLVLGVGYEATDTDVRAAFGELTKRYHPDRFARYESTELRQIAAEIFILIRDAYRRLNDEHARSQALAGLGRTPAAPRAIPDVRAAAESQPIRRPPLPPSAPPRQPTAKIPLVKEAVELGPAPRPVVDQKSGSVSVSRTPPPVQTERRPMLTAPPPVITDNLDAAQLEEILDAGHIDEALAAYKVMTKKHPQDRVFRAGIELCEGLRALGARDRLEAAQRFETALEIDPSNERAARELADMRRQATNERKGLLSRLMGKKEP
ncbi:MAG TPA: DnaJ domain-containing protein [Kofleriaceae bacterium]|jgi:DnaJ-domain-containing protein 1